MAGNFADAAGIAAADHLAAWTGTKWMALGDPSLDGTPSGLLAAGRTLYLAGPFTSVAGIANTADLAAYGLPAPPTAPRSLAGSAGSRKVTLSWRAPSSTRGGGPVRDSVIQYRKKGATTWKTFADGVRTTRSATVTGLTRGTTYQFRVLARNDWGTGPRPGGRHEEGQVAEGRSAPGATRSPGAPRGAVRPPVDAGRSTAGRAQPATRYTPAS